MQFSDIYALVQDQTQDTSSGSLVRIKKYINLGQKEIASQKDWPELRTSATLSVTSGTESYTLADDFNKLIFPMRITSPAANAFAIDTYRDYEMFRNTWPLTSNTSNGIPQNMYFTSGNSVNFFPIPNGSYTITYEYYKVPTALTDDTNEPFFPEQWHHLLVDYALWWYYKRDQDPIFVSYETAYRNGLAQLLASSFTRSTEPKFLGLTV